MKVTSTDRCAFCLIQLRELIDKGWERWGIEDALLIREYVDDIRKYFDEHRHPSDARNEAERLFRIIRRYENQLLNSLVEG